MGQTHMITTIEIIDRLKAVNGWTDYHTARELEITPQAVSGYRKGRRIMDNQTGLKAAELLGLPAELLLVSLEAERSLNSPVFEVFEALAAELSKKKQAKSALKKLASVAALLVITAHANLTQILPAITTT